MALELIENTERKKGIMVDVTGKMEDEALMVASIKEHKEEKLDEKADMKKKMYKQK